MTLRRALVYAAAGALAYALALIATAPAPWIAHAVQRASGERLQLREASGTLWTGSGRLYAQSRAGAAVDLGELRWRGAWSGLLAGRLAAEIALGRSARATEVEVSLGGMRIQNLDVELPAQALASFAPGLEGFGPQGVLRLRSEGLSLDEGSVLGLAEIEWRRVRFARVPALELGSHVARLRGGGSRVDIELGTLEGPLQLSGKGTWEPGAGFAMAGAAEHEAQAAPELPAFLDAVCAGYRDNRCTFRFRL